MNTDEIAANESDSPLRASKTLSAKGKELLQNEMDDEEEGEDEEDDKDESPLFGRAPPLKPIPVRKTLADIIRPKVEERLNIKSVPPDPHRYDDPTAVVLQLKKTEDILRRHIKGFRCFQLFVVIAILLLCVIVIIMAEKFPAAVAPKEHP